MPFRIVKNVTLFPIDGSIDPSIGIPCSTQLPISISQFAVHNTGSQGLIRAWGNGCIGHWGAFPESAASGSCPTAQDQPYGRNKRREGGIGDSG